MTTTSQPDQPPPEIQATAVTPAQKLALTALGATLGRDPQSATSMLVQLVTKYGRQGVHEALVLLCSLPVSPLAHRCMSGGSVSVPLPDELPEDKRNLWEQSAITAGELLAGTFGDNGIRLRTALETLNEDNVLAVLTLVSQYVTGVLDAANKAAGAATSEYRALLRERAGKGGSS